MPTVSIPDIVNGRPIVIFSIPGADDIIDAPETKRPIPANMPIICSFIRRNPLLFILKRRCHFAIYTPDG